ncbi:MAG: RagB/SusD family nutrient uptake outer membrane protein [Bacteroidales bacterium]|jgi:hypothetical protein|nr:RagB/SusD family nutrient uptake outer membrane protein [Bacteroidales bacterium]
MKSNIIIILLLVGTIFFYSCNEYLDVIPDNVATLEHAYSNRASAERALFTCYSYLPDPANPNASAGLLSGRELWLATEGLGNAFGTTNPPSWNIARGLHFPDNPMLDYWNGLNYAMPLFVAIRDCNIFLENIHKPVDLESFERTRWIAEVKFLKAYYHFYLLRMYGPIPIIKENIPVSATPEEARVYRDPVEDVVEYIVALLDECAPDLPVFIQNQTQELGRITRPIALALKAKTLVLLASPIFNGNPYYTNVTDNRGIRLFPQTEEVSRWEAAALALDAAIECAHDAGHRLYYYNGYSGLSSRTINKLHLRGAVTDRWNDELIWGSTKNDEYHCQIFSAVRTNHDQFPSPIRSILAPTLDAVERFYSNHGVPIEEDNTYDYENRYQMATVGIDHEHFLTTGVETAKLHFNRETRFYASLSFDGSVLFGNGQLRQDVAGNIQMKKGDAGGMIGAEKYSITGYVPKKLVNIESSVDLSTWTHHRYAFPYIRLADLYLMYAEALNEIKAAPDDEVYYWINEVRTRASLGTVQTSWDTYSTRSTDYLSKEGMRRIIRRERLNELAFEGPAYWDQLRWLEAENTMSRPIRGWNVQGETSADYYRVTQIATTTFEKRHYLMPIKIETLAKNPNLVQNPGW